MSEIKRVQRVKRCGIICVKYIFGVAHLLIVRGKKSHIWSLPKGCINEGESEIECAQRETLEESGLLIDITEQNVRVSINHNVYFVAIIQQHPKLRIRDKAEIDKVNWMTLEEIKRLECNKDLRSILYYPNRKFAFHIPLIPILKMNEVDRPVESESSEEEVVEIISYSPPPGLDIPSQGSEILVRVS
jgi:ADP-ribose pyrophosphatase YjhB (NUDIX family)